MYYFSKERKLLHCVCRHFLLSLVSTENERKVFRYRIWHVWVASFYTTLIS